MKPAAEIFSLKSEAARFRTILDFHIVRWIFGLFDALQAIFGRVRDVLVSDHSHSLFMSSRQFSHCSFLPLLFHRNNLRLLSIDKFLQIISRLAIAFSLSICFCCTLGKHEHLLSLWVQ